MSVAEAEAEARAATRPARPLRYLLWMTGSAALILLIVCLLPHDRHLRFSSLHAPAVLKAKWIYERIHFDPTPTDVVLIGTSRTVFGLDSARIEAAYRAATGADLHVVNFGMQHFGRDVHWLIAREVLRSRHVKTLVVEVQEEESRDLHPAFASLADPADLMRAPLLINTRYFDNLSHLPQRQLRLFVGSLPLWLGRQRPGLGDAYAGPHWDDSYRERGEFGPNMAISPRLATHTAAELLAVRDHFAALLAPKIRLPAPLRPLEFRANLAYLDGILDEAAKAGVAVRFFYTPSFGAMVPPAEAALYAPHGPTWLARDVFAGAANWLDSGHMNHRGAEALSDWLGAQLAADTPLVARAAPRDSQP